MRSLVLLLALSFFAQAEDADVPVETPRERYDRILKQTHEQLEKREQEDQRAIKEDLETRDRTFLFLRRDGDGPFTSLTAKTFGLKQGSCRLDTLTGEVNPDAQFKMRVSGDGESVEILAKSPKDKSWIPSLGAAKPKPVVRWKLKRKTNASFDVCQVDGQDQEGLNGCKNWTIASLETVDATAFIKGEGDDHKISKNDITQGNLGTCTLWASVLAILESRGPEEIEALFGPGNVTFPGQKPIPVGEQFILYWNPRLPDVKLPLGVRFGDTDERGSQESWPVLLEKAYTVWRRSVQNADNGANPATVLSLLSGEKVKTFYFSSLQNKNLSLPLLQSQQADFDCLKLANENGLPIVCGSRGKVDESLGLSPNHAYAISKVNGGDEPSVVVVDPHGAEYTLPFATFRENFVMAAHTNGNKSFLRRKVETGTKTVLDAVDTVVK